MLCPVLQTPKGLPISQNVTYCKLAVINIGKESEKRGTGSKRLMIFFDTENKLELKYFHNRNRECLTYQTNLENSITEVCRPRHMPRNGFLVSRHHLQASIFPSTPRLPKPPGTITPLRADTMTGLNICISNQIISTIKKIILG